MEFYNEETMSYTWISAQNLIGGMALGFENIFGTPNQIITNGVSNDVHYLHYTNDIRKLNVPIINSNADYTEFDGEVMQPDVIAMTPVCAGLSMLNRNSDGERKRGDCNNIQNQNMYNLLRFALKQRPRIIAFENAPGLYTKMGEGVCNKLKEIAFDAGYSMGLYKTNTLYHGVCQFRPRTFAMFYRDTAPAIFEYEKKPYKQFADYIADVDKNPNAPHFDLTITFKYKHDYLINYLCEYTGTSHYYDAVRKLVASGEIPEKDNYTSMFIVDWLGIPECLKYLNKVKSQVTDPDDIKQVNRAIQQCEHVTDKTSQGKGYFDMTASCILDHTNSIIGKNINIIHPTEKRPLNLRELMSLMALPDDFEMVDPARTWINITQNVPVCTATFIASQCKKYLDGELKLANKNFIKQTNDKGRLDVGDYAVENW